MKSFLLDRDVWDLVLDAKGNIACASAPYARTQDVACACRLFRGECWYGVSKGIPYDTEILGQWPPLPLVRERLVEAAMTVPGVVAAQVVVAGIGNRKLTGQVQYIDETGASHGVKF